MDKNKIKKNKDFDEEYSRHLDYAEHYPRNDENNFGKKKDGNKKKKMDKNH